MVVQRPGKSCLMIARRHMVSWALGTTEKDSLATLNRTENAADQFSTAIENLGIGKVPY